MAESIYQCEVNKSHTRKIPSGKRIAQYYCCGKPMTKIQSPVTAGATPKLQCHGPTQSSAQVSSCDTPPPLPESLSQQKPAA